MMQLVPCAFAKTGDLKSRIVADGLRLTKYKLSLDLEDADAELLLEFLLAIDEDNEEILLLVSNVDESIQVDSPSLNGQKLAAAFNPGKAG